MSLPGRCRASRLHPGQAWYAAIALLSLLPFTTGCGGEHEGNHRPEAGHDRPEVDHMRPDNDDVVIPPRTPQLATFPCVEQCHRSREPDPSPRPLRDFHSVKHIEHGDTTFWCNFCHNTENLDTLRLLDDRIVTFDEAYRLCGQCHGDKRRDWAMGIHGLQTGYWNGERTRRSCTACHDPHSPRRPRFQALPPPRPRTGEP